MTKRRRIDTVSSFGRMPARQPAKPAAPLVPPPEPRERPAPRPSGVRQASTVSPEARHEPAPAGSRLWGALRGTFTENLAFKLLAVILSTTLFLLVNTDRDREIMARVGVSYTLPDGKVLVSPRLDEVRINVRGPWRRLRRFDEREIDRVNLDLSRVSSGEAAITADMIKLPPGLTLVSWSPRTVPVAFEERVEKTIEVSPMVVGRPLHGYVVSEINVTPRTVRVRGAAGDLAGLAVLRTAEIRVDGRSTNLDAVVALNPPDGVEVFPPGPVSVELHLEELLVTRRLPGIAVTLTGDSVSPTALQAEPAEVEVVLTGSMRAVEAAAGLVGKTLLPTVRVAASDLGRRHSAPVTPVMADGLPAGLGIEIVPSRVQVGPRK